MAPLKVDVDVSVSRPPSHLLWLQVIFTTQMSGDVIALFSELVVGGGGDSPILFSVTMVKSMPILKNR